MKNKVSALLAVIVLCLTMIMSVSAEGVHIFDEANYISSDSEATLETYAQQIENNYNVGVLFSVVESTGEYGTYEYAEKLYNDNSEYADGIALVYDRGENVYFFYCSGEAQIVFTDDVQTRLWQAFANNETYFDSVYSYFTEVEAVLKESKKSSRLVVDNADVLTDSEETELTSRLEALGNEYSIEIGILTVDSYEGKEGQAFADDYYDYNGYGYGENNDGLIVVFNTGEGDGTRNITITAHGTAEDLLTVTEMDVILEMMSGDIKNGDYMGAFNTFIDECEGSFGSEFSVFWIPISILIGFGLSYLVVKIQASKLKTVRKQVDAADYVGNVMLTADYDNFLYRDVRSVPKPKSNSSSSHTSSSGRSHTGSSKNF